MEARWDGAWYCHHKYPSPAKWILENGEHLGYDPQEWKGPEVMGRGGLSGFASEWIEVIEGM